MASSALQTLKCLKYEYCFSIDAGRYEEWTMLFTEDGCLIQGNGDEVQGHEELYAFASEEFVQAFPETAHIVTNPLIQVNGDEATGEWYLFLLYKDADGEKDWTQAKYDDEYRKVKKGWRIARSRVDYGVQ